MISSAELFGAAIFATIIGTTILFHRPAPSLAGADPVPTVTAFHFQPAKERADGTVTVTTAEGLHTSAYVAHGRVYQNADQRDAASKAGLKFEYQRDRYLYDPGLDAGAFASYWAADVSERKSFQVGARVSPFRLLYGTIAPDALATKDGVGYGVSVYFPAEYFQYEFLDHIGLELGRLHPYDGSGSGNLIGISFASRF